ncbi:MAG: ammonium transporter [Nevskiaceae bacterium]|nr:MAG: ammonium transporter [Nevskiaceae bacterium]
MKFGILTGLRCVLISLPMALGIPVAQAIADEAAAPAAATAPVASPAPAAPVPAAPAPVAAPTHPVLVGVDKINSGDTAWMLASTALVLLMTIPGLALFYAGMVRKKNVLSTALQSFAICCLVTVIWVVIGYSLAFTPGGPFLGSLERLMLSGMAFIKDSGQVTVSHVATTIPESVFVMFQMTFAIITPALITGAFAERIRFGAMILFIGLWSILVYAPVAHWVWEPGGWLATLGAQDFAGGTVVHINAGAAGLMCAYVLGRRKGYGEDAFVPYNLGFTLIGASLLWVGWFGFNAGSAVAADGRAGMAMLVTQVATATASLTWMLVEYFARGRSSLLGACSGAVAGLVAITPASGFVNLGGALVIGVAAGVCCYWGATGLKHLLGADDSLDVFGIHGIGGIVGALLTGVFADKEICGASGSLLVQAIGAFSTLIYSGIVSLTLLLLIDFTIGLRVPREHETLGLDLSQHGEQIS